MSSCLLASSMRSEAKLSTTYIMAAISCTWYLYSSGVVVCPPMSHIVKLKFLYEIVSMLKSEEVETRRSLRKKSRKQERMFRLSA